MRVLLFGASGMLGQGVLRECLAAADVSEVTAVGRNPSGAQHAKLRELLRPDMFDYHAVEAELQGYDACFFCLGVSSSGMTEAGYSRVSYDLTMAAATVLSRLNPQMVFVYVTGAGADSSEQGKIMWARVKGRTENALLRLPFKGAYMFRPGLIQPMHGIQSKTASYRILYALSSPIVPLLRKCFPKQVLSTEIIGVAMLNAARGKAGKSILESADIYALSQL